MQLLANVGICRIFGICALPARYLKYCGKINEIEDDRKRPRARNVLYTLETVCLFYCL